MIKRSQGEQPTQPAHDDHQFWRNFVRDDAGELPLNGDVRDLAAQWLGGHLSNEQTFEAIENLTEGQVPGDDGSLTGTDCFQRTLERVKDLLGLQHAVLFCLEHEIERAEERQSEFQKMLAIARDPSHHPRQPSLWEEHIDKLRSQWLSGKTGGTEIILALSMFVDAALGTSLVLGLPEDHTRDSHAATIKHGFDAMTLQFAAEKAIAEGVSDAAGRSRILESLTQPD